MPQRFQAGDTVQLQGGGSYTILDGNRTATAHWDTQTAHGIVREVWPRRGRSTLYQVEPIAPGFGLFGLQARDLERFVPEPSPDAGQQT